MSGLTTVVMLLLMASILWVLGAALHWANLRRQEKLIAQLRRLSVRRPPARPLATSVAPEAMADALRPANRWTVD